MLPLLRHSGFYKGVTHSSENTVIVRTKYSRSKEFFTISVCLLPLCVCAMAYLHVMMHHFDKGFQAPFLSLRLYPRIHLALETDPHLRELKTVSAKIKYEHLSFKIVYYNIKSKWHSSIAMN